MKFTSIDPATEEVIEEIEGHSAEEVERRIARAEKASENWREMPLDKRAEFLENLASILKERSRPLGEMMSAEMGKPVLQAVAEAEKCALVLNYYAENASRFLEPVSVETEAGESFVRFDPLGPVLAVMPWNFPFWQVLRFAAPAVAAGNVGLLKHASNVPRSAITIEELFTEAGFPEGVFQTLLIGSKDVEGVIRDSRVKAVTLTGSTKAGSEVARIAGEEIKKSVLELGGSDPFIVLADADVPVACDVADTARLQNNGQSCLAAKRFIVVEERFEEFLDLFKKRFESKKIGNPLEDETEIGPMATKSIRDEVEKQVNDSLEAGARLVTGGKRWGEKGYFYEPTILAEIPADAPAYREEIFGPVASVIRARDEGEAIRIANDTEFGLGASIWTEDIGRAKELVEKIDAGNIFINGMVRSDPRLPFGGIKKSGYGRELSEFGIREFVNIKTVWIK